MTAHVNARIGVHSPFMCAQPHCKGPDVSPLQKHLCTRAGASPVPRPDVAARAEGCIWAAPGAQVLAASLVRTAGSTNRHTHSAFIAPPFCPSYRTVGSTTDCHGLHANFCYPNTVWGQRRLRWEGRRFTSLPSRKSPFTGEGRKASSCAVAALVLLLPAHCCAQRLEGAG